MILAAFKEVLQDRLDLLTLARDKASKTTSWQQGYLYGRREELRVCLRLAESLKLDEDHLPFTSDLKGGQREHIPWGKQSRGHWPQSTFGTVDEAEPGVNRYDPGRC
jgi:hypothetical protein